MIFNIANWLSGGRLSDWLLGQVGNLLGLSGVSSTSLGQGLSDKYLGTTYNSDRQRSEDMIYNAEQAQIDRNWQERMWNMTNAYNSPQSQMQRFRDAGLNPSLMMSGGLSGTEATIPSGAQAAHSGSVGFGSGNIMDLLKVKSEINLMDAQASNLESRTETENFLRQARLDNLLALVNVQDAKVADYISQIKKRVHDNALTDAERDNIGFEQMYKTNQLSIDWSRLQNETKLNDAQIDNLKAGKEEALARARVTNREYDEMVYTFAIRAAGLEAQVNLTGAQVEQAKATARKLGLESDMLEGPAEYERYRLNQTDNGTALQGILGITRYTIQGAIRDLFGRLH